MNKNSRLASLFPALMIWLILSVLFWCWIFTFLTDTDAAHKITVFADTAACSEKELALILEEDLPEEIRMVKVHRFSYAMFNSDGIRNADLYIFRASDLETVRDWLAPLPEGFADRASLFDENGTPLGITVYDPAGTAAAESFLTYFAPGETPELCYLAFGISSLHLPGNEEALTTSAGVAEKILLLQ